MNRVEELLERLISVNESILSKLDEVSDQINDMNNELQWTDNTSMAGQLCSHLQGIINEFNWTEPGNFAEALMSEMRDANNNLAAIEDSTASMSMPPIE